jgi:hypothetical protein
VSNIWFGFHIHVNPLLLDAYRPLSGCAVYGSVEGYGAWCARNLAEAYRPAGVP